MSEMNEKWTPEEERLSAALHAQADNVTPGPDGLAQIRRRTVRAPWWRRPAFLTAAAGGLATAAAVIIAVNSLGTDGGDLSVSPADSPTTTEPASPRSPESTPDDDTVSDDDDATVGPTESPADSEDADTGDVDDGADAESDDQDQPPGDDAGDGDGTGEEDANAEPDSVYMAAEGSALPVYYVIDGRITREWQRVDSTDNALVTAVHQTLNGPSFDPRYETLWAPVDVVSAEVVDDVIEVNLSSPVELAASPESAEVAVQQLVYTATATAGSLVDGVSSALPVQILVDGEPPTDLFGQLDMTEPVTRDDQNDVRYFVQIDNPGYGAEVAGPVTVDGVAAVHEANLLWELRRDGEVVDSGYTSTEEAFTFSGYSIDLGDLDPGTYEITVMEDDVSGGEGRDPYSETKEFTVLE
ncbi:Gmad2 immunoglobulin-like domain-containing protein [Phytoactinopolyspora endophytica]|uniref:Gmad2 immunoglobulin-like domain-containing protein n=1 Tax=Phytoactinopolyspora endophytica TaxID=1642495 RepID=UPI00101E0177|nr:Gmad2 immunoglobulin-like domain-containing protein [Phytoactinopolyspora endophytica]